jgi:hypothetical protein
MVSDEDLAATEDFLNHCKDKNLNPEDPESLEIFKNFIIDHGGSLECCA